MADDYAAAAIRHLRDAEHLAANDRFDNAAHLIGFARGMRREALHSKPASKH